MSIIHGLCTTYIAEAFRGVHSDSDTYKLALYTDKADLNEACQTYLPTHEVSGPGYKAGGTVLDGFEVMEDGSSVVFAWADAHWDRMTVSNAWGGLIYNASKGNRAVGVVAFGGMLSCTNGPLDLEFPVPAAGTAVFVIN
jgi:hypothetical protein